MRWGIEKNPRQKLERTADRSEYASDRKMIFESASRKKEKVFADAIKEKNFSKTVYPEEEVRKDLKYVREAEESFKEGVDEESEKGVELARIFEAIICEQGELANWFGENSMTIKSARYDDLKNGVDLIIEFTDNDEENSHLALAVDVTFSSFEKLYEKLDGIKADVESGKLSYIKYFQSEKTGFQGDIKGVPKTVIGADPRTLYQLMDLWVGEKEEELERHPIQFMILDQIMIQLTKFKELAESKNKSFIAGKYEKAIETVGKILNEKQDLREKVLGGDDSVIANDRVHQAIVGHMGKMNTQKGPKVYKY
jgi:hypothetical protein